MSKLKGGEDRSSGILKRTEGNDKAGPEGRSGGEGREVSSPVTLTFSMLLIHSSFHVFPPSLTITDSWGKFIISGEWEEEDE